VRGRVRGWCAGAFGAGARARSGLVRGRVRGWCAGAFGAGARGGGGGGGVVEMLRRVRQEGRVWDFNAGGYAWACWWLVTDTLVE